MKIIAEIGWNHMGDMTLAKKMMESAKNSGANMVKFQYWDPANLKPGPWDSDGRREIYNNAALSKNKIIELIEFSNSIGCEFLISVFGTMGANVIKEMGQKKVKIPSHETANSKLIKFCSNNFDEVIFSAGASTEKEIKEAVEILKSGKSKFSLLHCISSYPCPSEKINLRRISWLSEFNTEVGLSDHTQSTTIPAISLAFGASIIEKHFTTDNNLPGRDNKFALNPILFKEMVNNIYEAQKSLVYHGNSYLDIEEDTINNYRGRWEPNDY
jgi:sialic acid synthase SpsE